MSKILTRPSLLLKPLSTSPIIPRFLNRPSLQPSFDLRSRLCQHLYSQVAFSRRHITPKEFSGQSAPYEEEKLPGYEPDQFWAINIGDTLNSRYTVIGKLGFGANSTVWLCRDLNNNSFVAVKVYTKTRPSQTHREQTAYEHLSAIESSNPGRLVIRQLRDSFYLFRADGARHYCLVHPPLHTTMFDLQRYGGKIRPFPEGLVKDALRSILQALEFLHTEAGITHCDLKLSNLMLQIEDKSVLTAFADDEQIDPVPRKVVSAERTIYGSRKFRHPRAHEFGALVLCDFGEARVGSSFEYQEIQPAAYKAPEVLLQIQWNQMVDIWNVACIAWEMVQGEHLFDGHDEEGYHNNRVHIGEMVGLLGHPPLDLQHQSANSRRVFDEKGQWRGNPPLSRYSLEERLTQLQGPSKSGFLAFLRSMMRWRAEERKSACQLLKDPWLAD